MKSAIEKIFYGTFANIENLKPSAEESQHSAIAVECDKKLQELLKNNEAALTLFEQYKQAADESECAELLTFYKEGFRNGFQIALDAMNED